VIAVVTSELYRFATIRSVWVSIVVVMVAAYAVSFFGAPFWGLVVGMGTFAITANVVGSQFAHRTVVLTYLARPNRLVVLAGQIVASALVGAFIALISAIGVRDEPGLIVDGLIAVPLIAVFAAALATLVRRPLWLILGFVGWLIIVEGVIGQLDYPLPITMFLAAISGEQTQLGYFCAWTAGALALAVLLSRRDVTG
jgi:phosphatidylglycerophosphatase A